MKLNVLKRKLFYLIERIKLSELDYLSMKAASQMYSSMMSAITYKAETEYEDIEDKNGHIITKITKSKYATINVDMEELLASAGVRYNKYAVKVNVTGI